jgi:hypothetical protein
MATSNIKILIGFICVICLGSCASYGPQYGKDTNSSHMIDTIQWKKPAHTFVLVGDAGYAAEPLTQYLFDILTTRVKAANENSTLLFLGDNIYPLGMPVEKDTKARKDAEESLRSQIELAKLLDGKSYFIPGNHDWYNGIEGLLEQEKFINARLKKAFLPGKGCAIKEVEISDKITMIAIDSEWYIEDWDNYPLINDDCNIKTREGLFTELESLLNNNMDKTVILAIHHPLMSNGTHGGHFAWDKQLYPMKYKIPLPVIGSVVNLARKASGYSTQDIQSRVYISLTKRIKSLIQDKNNVIVVSGHDHNLQYIKKDNIHQIISGSGSKVEAAKAVNPLDFAYGGIGYSILDIYDDGTAKVSFFGIENDKEKKLFEMKITELQPDVQLKDYPDKFPPTVSASVYTPEMTDKSGLHEFLFGKHYREHYSRPVVAQTVMLDTLFGGLEPVKAGGGHQSLSLQLKAKDGKEYVMRGLKKSATRFLKTVAFKNSNIGDAFEGTFAEDFLLDFYTTAHPYTPFIVADLAEEGGIYHTNPKLYYIPKQDALKEFNQDYGDQLYMVEERADKSHKDLASFGKPKDTDNTEKLMENLRKDPKFSVDERSYIRARLFDMLIGDWDRHTDQWEWGQYEDGDKVVYKPIPKDRDQAFTKYDGNLLSLIMRIPALRHMQSFEEDIKNVKWFNREPYALDLRIITKSYEKVWIEEAQSLMNAISDADIDKAFAGLPQEVQDATTEEIKNTLKKRKPNLESFARQYYHVLQENVVLTGSDKEEKFVVTRLPAGHTQIVIYSMKDSVETEIHNRVYDRGTTSEIWLYGLDGNDIFEVSGDGDKQITLRLIGGINNDTYNVTSGRKVKIYDFRSKENVYNVDKKAKLILTDNYETNTYDFEKPKYNVAAIYPSAGFNPDDGVKLGGIFSFTVNNFNRRPFSQKHTLKANYYFATAGFEFDYRAVFMNASTRWNFGFDAAYTSPNFSINYFGLGNETINPDDETGLDYNRVKLQIFRVAPSIFTESRNGSFLQFQAAFETVEIDGTTDRFVNQPGVAREELFSHRQFGQATVCYSFENYDNRSLPSLGMSFFFLGGWKTSLDEIKQNFPFVEASVALVHKITHNDKLVLATNLKTRLLFSDQFEFYQGATLGGDKDLRGYRRERFTGKRSFFQSTDLRYTLGNLKSSFIPMKYGIFCGFDYGRVWVEQDTSDKWHTSTGGGFFINSADALTARLAYFQGSEGGRVSFGLSFGF